MAVTLEDLLKANEAKMYEGSAAPEKGVTTADLIAANEAKMNEGSAAPEKSVTIEDLMKANEEKMAQEKSSVSMKTPSAWKSGMTVFQNFDQSVQDAFQNSKGEQVKENLDLFTPASGGSMASGSDLLSYNQKLNTKLLTQQKQALEAEREEKVSSIDANRLAAQDTVDIEGIRALAKQSEEDRARVKEIDQKLKDIEYQLGGGKPSAWERIGKTLSGAGKQYLGSTWDTAGTVMPGGTAVTEVYEEQLENLYDEKARTEEWLKDPEDEQERIQLESRLEAINSQIAVYENSVRANRGVSSAARDAAKELTQSGAQDLERAKLGTGLLGGLLVDAGAAAAQMGGDALLGTLTGSAMVPMMVRSFGSGAQEAREKGYSQEKQVALGITSAATEYFTEKLFGGNPVYDTDAGLVNTLVSRLTDNEKLISALASAPAEKLYEGLEEIASDILNPIAEYVITGNWDMQGVDEILRDGAVGVIAALAAGGVQKVGETAGKAAQRVSDKLTLPRAGEEMVLPRAAEMENAVPLSEGTAESTIVNDDPARHTAQEQAVIENYKKSVDGGLLAFISKVKTLTNPRYRNSIRYSISESNAKETEAVKNLAGIDASGFENIITGSAIDHIEKRHGENGKADRSMKDANDIARLPYVLENFDNAELLLNDDGTPSVSDVWKNSDGTPAKRLVFYKKIDGTYYAAIAAPDSNAKVLAIESAFIGKGKGSTGTVLNMEKSPQVTPETPQRANASFTNATIAQNVPGVNTAYAEQAGAMQRYPNTAMTLPRAGEEMVLPRAAEMETAVPMSEGTAESINADNIENTAANKGRTAIQEYQRQAKQGEILNEVRTHLTDIEGMEPVKKLTGNEFQKTEGDSTSLRKKVIHFFNSIGNKVFRQGMGEIELNNAGAHDSLAHGYGRLKAATFAALPDVLQNGKLINQKGPYEGHEYDSYFIAAPVEVGGERCYVGALVIKDDKMQRYKLHEVLVTNSNGVSLFQSESGSNASPLRSDTPSGNLPGSPVIDTTIAQNAPGVNTAYAEQAGTMQQGYQKKDGGYTGTKHTDKLGIKIAEPIAGLEGAERLVARQQAAYKSKRQLQRKVKELNPTAAEREFAIGLSKGIYTEQDAVVRFGRQIQSMNMDKVRELADYYRAAQSFDVDRIAEKRRENTRNEEAIAESLLKNSDEYKVPSTLSLNANTMKRNVLNIFGRREGAAINARYFDPVTKNSAESIRFINRMYDRVRDFHLSKSESELVQRVMEGSAVADQVSKMSPDLRKRVESVAKSKDKQLSAAEFHLNKEQTEIAERYSQWLDTTARLQDEDVDAGKVTKAAKAYSDAYDDFYAAINDFLVAHGYEPIGFIKGYAPHQQREDIQQGFARVLQRMGIDSNVNELPTEIAGRTADFKPGKQWNPYFQHRKGDAGELDAVSGYESYINFMANVFYHTDDVQKLRVLSNTLRTKYSNEEISNQISWAKGLRDAPTEVKTNFLIDENRIAPDKVLTKQEADDALEEYISAQFDKIDNMTKYGSFVTALDDYANKLAGKQTKLDRAVEEGLFGRRALNVGNNLSKIFGESTIVGNLSSALNQMAQLPVVQAEVGNKYVLWAMKDILSGEAKRTGFDTESDFITGKLGTENLTGERSWKDSDAKGKRAKVMDAASIPFEAVDNFASRLIVRAKYLREVNEGASHEQAIKAADNFAEKVVGSRMKGAKPMLFESKNIFSKLATTFQLEIANSWAHISKDLRWDIQDTAKTQGKAKAVKMAAGIASKYVVEAFLLNRLSETIYGGTPAPFDLLGYIVGGLAAGSGQSTNTFLVNLVLDVVNKLKGNGGDEDDEEFDVEAALGEAGSLIVGDMPYVRNIASMLGYGDSSLPLPKLPTKTVKSLWDMIHGQEGAGQDLAYNAVNELTDWLPMGNQAQKTIQGIQSVAKGGRYNGDKLMYPMDTSGVLGKLRAAKAILFGNSSMSAADDYYAGGAKPLSEKQTAAYEQIVGSGEDQQTVYDTMKAVRGVKDVPDSTEDNKQKRAIIRDAQISDLSKAAIYSAMISESRDEDFAAMMDAGVSFSEIMDVYDTYEDISDMDLSKTQMATEFAKEMDLRYNKDAADMYKEYFLYWINMPAEAKSYDKFSAEGFGAEKSAELSGIVSEISGQSAEEKRASLRDMEISDGDKARVYYVYLASDSEAEFLDGLSETGYGTVQAYQLLMQMKDNEVSIKEYQKLVDAGLKDDAYIISVAKATADDNLSNWRAVVNQAKDDDTALKTLSAYMTESQYAKAEIAIGQYSISPSAYVTVQEEIAKPGYEGKVNQEVVKDAIDHVAGLSNTERAVLWQLATSAKSGKNNPYSAAVGAEVYKLLNGD